MRCRPSRYDDFVSLTRAAHQALHYHASLANLALESDAWASLVDPRNARAAPGVARRTFGARASSVRSSARQRSAPLSRARFRVGFVRASEEHTSLAREVSRRIRSRVRGAHLSRADSSPSRPFLGFPKSALASESAMPEPTATMSPTPCARVPDRAIGANAVDASDEAFLERARADAAAAAMRKHKHRKQRSARRVAASATLLAIDEAASIDTRAPTARVTTITSVATLTRDDAPPGALQRVMSRAAPNGSRSRAPILASSSAPPPPGRRYPRAPRPSPHRFHLTHPRRRRRRLRHAPSRRRLPLRSRGRSRHRSRTGPRRRTSLARRRRASPRRMARVRGGRPTSRPTSRRRRQTAKRPNGRH